MNKKPKKYSGVVVPMITPFTRRGIVDYDAVSRITNNFIEAGVHPFIIGTTGEAASISSREKLEFVKFLSGSFKGKCTLYAGVSGNCFSETLEAAGNYLDNGIDVLVAHLPSYYPVNSYHMLNYFEKLASEINGPLIIYNIPGTTHISIPLDIVEKLSHIENIAGLKDSERDLSRLEQSIVMFKDREDFSHLVGWNAQCYHALSKGSDGIVPSTANFSPSLYGDMYKAVISGDLERASNLQLITDEISRVYQEGKILSEALAALKIMLNEVNICGTRVLPPLTELNEEDSGMVRINTRRIIQEYNLTGFEK